MSSTVAVKKIRKLDKVVWSSGAATARKRDRSSFWPRILSASFFWNVEVTLQELGFWSIRGLGPDFLQVDVCRFSCCDTDLSG